MIIDLKFAIRKQLNIKIIVIMIKRLQINQISALNNPGRLDMQLNK